MITGSELRHIFSAQMQLYCVPSFERRVEIATDYCVSRFGWSREHAKSIVTQFVPQ